MGKAIMLSLTVMCEDNELVLKASEAITRVQVGLAFEGLHTTLNISTVEYEEADQDHES